MPSIAIALNNDRRELARLAERIERFGAEHHVPADTITNVNLVLDEVVSNVIKYGQLSPPGSSVPAGAIDVSLSLDGGLLTIAVVDDGKAFNPLEAKPPDLDRPITERPVGGLGIHIVKALTDTIAYRRDNDRNYLTMTMRVQDRG